MAASNTRFTQSSLGQSKTPIDSDHGIYRYNAASSSRFSAARQRGRSRRAQQPGEQVRRIGVPTAGIGIDTLEDRIRQAVIAVYGQGTLPIQFCGWVQV